MSEPDPHARVVGIADDGDAQLRDHDGFRARRVRIGHRLGTERLGASVWEVEPGQAAYPYHLHLAEEELVLVLAGRPSLRTPDGWRDLTEGDLVSFPRGEAGAHQIVNRTGEPVRFLAISTNGEPDLVVYPDSGKLGAAERRPDGSGFVSFFRLADAVDYYEGEAPPA
jgi:uncharacterized cupin superfamily protein